MVGTTWAQPPSASATPTIAIFVLKILNIGHSFGWSSSLRQAIARQVSGLCPVGDELLLVRAWFPVASKNTDEWKLVPTGLLRPDAETINDQSLKNSKDREEDQYRTRGKD